MKRGTDVQHAPTDKKMVNEYDNMYNYITLSNIVFMCYWKNEDWADQATEIKVTEAGDQSHRSWRSKSQNLEMSLQKMNLREKNM